MIRIKAEKDFVNAFRPRDRRALELPKDLAFPMILRSPFSWVQPAGAYVYLVFEDPTSGRPLGLTFRRDGGPGKGLAGRVCDWCHSYGGAEQIDMLMCEKSSKRTVGAYLCRDLDCARRVEDAADRAGKNVKEQHDRLLARMWQFAHEGLGIESVPDA